MFRRVASLLGIGGAASPVAAAKADAEVARAATPPGPPHSPYIQPHVNHIYNLLFCDLPDLFQPRPGEAPVDWQQRLFAPTFDAADLAALAADQSQDSRVRAVAYEQLRQHGHAVPKGHLLGVIVEMPIEQRGLDVLAAFADGNVRYINHAPSLAFVDGEASLRTTVQRLFALSQTVVDSIGPWDKLRLPAPSPERFRLSFVASDGLYFGDLPMSAITEDPRAAPIMQVATELMQAVTKIDTGQGGVERILILPVG